MGHDRTWVLKNVARTLSSSWLSFTLLPYFPPTTRGLCPCGRWRLYKAVDSFIVPACDPRGTRDSSIFHLHSQGRTLLAQLEDCVHSGVIHGGQRDGGTMIGQAWVMQPCPNHREGGGAAYQRKNEMLYQQKLKKACRADKNTNVRCRNLQGLPGSRSHENARFCVFLAESMKT